MVKHLSGFDATFLYSETPRTHMHTLKVLVFSLPEERGEALRQKVVRGVESQLAQLPALRLRPVSVPVGHPVWKPEAPVVDEHVALVALDDAPHARERAIGEFLSVPLRRDRPLWEILVLQDEAHGQLAVALKIHHSVADGKAAERMLEVASGSARAPAGEDPGGWSLESWRQLALMGAGHTARGFFGLGRLVYETSRGLVERLSKQSELHASLVLPFVTPHPHFTRPVTHRRELAFVSLPFDAVRRIKQAAGVTVNDVVLAVAAAGLRRYLARRRESVTEPLVAAMPVGVDHVEYSYGNHLSNLFLPLHVQEAEPLARLRSSARSAGHAKQLHAALGGDLLMGWSELMLPLVLRGLWGAVRMTGQVPASLIVSNVPGPREPISFEGAKLERIYSVGPLLETTGLNITFWSYGGCLHGTLLMCPDHGGDPRELAADLEAELAALHEAVARVERQPPTAGAI